LPQIILLGASNLTIGFPLLLDNLRRELEGPIHVYAALGLGRSYGISSRVLCRGLPGIVGCNLWAKLEQNGKPPGSTFALVTDVGNDLLYNVEVSQIVAWVKTCLDRLVEQRAEIVMTLLPIASVERMSSWRYSLFRTIFFPTTRISLPEVLQRARDLNAQLQQLGREYGVPTFEPPGEWYGFDPIHIASRHRCQAWNRILSGWPSLEPSTEFTSASWRTQSRFLRSRPAERRLCGRLQTMRQPVLKLDQTDVFLY
jgi:hypothetical protein